MKCCCINKAFITPAREVWIKSHIFLLHVQWKIWNDKWVDKRFAVHKQHYLFTQSCQSKWDEACWLFERVVKSICKGRGHRIKPDPLALAGRSLLAGKLKLLLPRLHGCGEWLIGWGWLGHIENFLVGQYFTVCLSICLHQTVPQRCPDACTG